MSTSVTFVSTRGTRDELSFGQAMTVGLARDGGLFVPRSIPSIDYTSVTTSDYASFAAEVLHRWIEEPAIASALTDICREAFDFDVPIVPLTGGSWDDCFVLELFHGRTNSFKDFGARFMARSLARFADDADQPITVLVATSGDTGSAVADGFSDQHNIRVILLYPDGQVSKTQERQLTVKRRGIQTFRVQGSFDDCQRLVKGAFASDRLSTVPLTSANSINIGRLLPQMIYYAWAAEKLDGVQTICVPSGNLGNLTAGVLAHLSGMQVQRFVASHNANSFFPEFLTDANAQFRPSVRTYSNAMDVGAPSNVERLKFLLDRQHMTGIIDGRTVTDDETIDTIQRVHRDTGYVACPHSSVGLRGIEKYRIATRQRRPALVLATAHPAKFGETVEQAIGVRPAVPHSMASLESQEISVSDLPASMEALEDVILSADLA